MTTALEVVPVSVGRVALAWDDQHLDVVGAARQVQAAPVDGFSVPVLLAASRFLPSWVAMTLALARACEQEADALRTTIRDFVATDTGVGELYRALLVPYVEERR